MESDPALALHLVPDDELLRRLDDLVAQSRRVEADLVAHIGEVDGRRLFPSMFAYCTEALRLSEAGAYRRITVARAARRFPVLLSTLREGRLQLGGLATLVSVLTTENCHDVLERATHRSKRQIEELVAGLSPRPEVPSVIRRLPQRPAQATQLSPGRVGAGSWGFAASGPAPAVVQPLAPARYKIQFTATAALRDKLERLVALMRAEVPDGDLAVVIELAVTEKLERLEARRFAHAKAPRKTLAATDTAPTSRRIPAAVRRAVRERDGGRCRFVDATGRRCSEQRRLEFHHRHPFSMGGDHSPGNVSLMCPAHNRYLAERDYGREAVSRHLATAGSKAGATRGTGSTPA
jgi:hypothetical protein